MKKTITLAKDFFLARLDCADRLDTTRIDALSAAMDSGGLYSVPRMPMQVHDILIANGVIEDPRVTGSGEPCLWVAETDWAYLCRFAAPLTGGATALRIGGLDVLADIYLNGERIGGSKDIFLPFEQDITGELREQNMLLIHFHSPHKYLETVEMPARYRELLTRPHVLFRGYHGGYCDYLGLKPYLTRVGVFGEITVAVEDRASIAELVVDAVLDEGFASGVVQVSVRVSREFPGLEVRCTLADPSGRPIAQQSLPVAGGCADFRQEVPRPVLWWPAGQGEQLLYTLRVSLCAGDVPLDEAGRAVGFRHIAWDGNFGFAVNGRTLRLWGANLAPIDLVTGCYDAGKAETILQAALSAHMNCLRVWGGGDRLPDRFYDRCDRLGILVWQDFYHNYSMYPDDGAFRSLCKAEAESIVAELRHHACVLLWCGGNETTMSRDFEFPGREYLGYAIMDEDYREVCGRLDPRRPYLLSSPEGGAYANDPLEGDTHNYSSTWYVPGGDYPVFVSEQMRATPPSIRAMGRMMPPEKLWPPGYDGRQLKGNDFPWPPTWLEYTSAQSWKKVPPYQNYYDADSAEAMIYRFAASTADYIKDTVERIRRGGPSGAARRICKGHLWWKMNTSSPHIYSGLLDCYLEPHMPFYALKRAYRPFLVSLEIGDHIRLWVVNDGPETVSGTVRAGLFHIEKNRVTAETAFLFRLEPGRSAELGNLDAFGQFTMYNQVLFTRAVDEAGQVLAEDTAYADIERHMPFPDCTLALTQEGDDLLVETDRFARCVELIGDDGGNTFGWGFSDNYFDLWPGRVRRIRISGGHRSGTVSAKGYYAAPATTISYRKKTD